MELRQLQYFLACAKAGSFSEAAKTLYSTQSNVSKAVKGLEDSLGLRLFERMPRGIRLTVQGERVYQYACKILNEVQALEQISGEESASWLRISFNPSSWFANQFVEFYKKRRTEITGIRFIQREHGRCWREFGIIWMMWVFSTSGEEIKTSFIMNWKETV